MAEDELTDQEIATQLGIGRATLDRWKHQPAFQTHVRQHIRDLGEQLSRYSIARKDKRLAEYDARWRHFKRIRAERAADETMAHVPGAATGMMVRRFKMIGIGPSASMVEEYEIDTAAAAEMRALEKQAAQETGQWTDKSDVTSGGRPLLEMERLIDTPVPVYYLPDAPNGHPSEEPA